MPNFTSWSSVLTPATSGKAPNWVEWTLERDDAFCKLKQCLCNFVILTVPLVDDEFSLHTDASGTGLGTVLNVHQEGKEFPVAFYSRQLKGAESRYSITELENLAILASIQHFLHYLYGHHFVVVTDGKIY